MQFVVKSQIATVPGTIRTDRTQLSYTTKQISIGETFARQGSEKLDENQVLTRFKPGYDQVITRF